jgi:hypothetical protein
MTYTELVGVYDADGGIVGEARYVIGHLLGRAECALCDITHSPVRRKPAWDAMTRTLGIPFALVHRNEQSPEVAAVTATWGLPAVVGRDASGRWHALLTRGDLRAAAGSVEQVGAALTRLLRAEH